MSVAARVSQEMGVKLGHEVSSVHNYNSIIISNPGMCLCMDLPSHYMKLYDYNNHV